MKGPLTKTDKQTNKTKKQRKEIQVQKSIRKLSTSLLTKEIQI